MIANPGDYLKPGQNLDTEIRRATEFAAQRQIASQYTNLDWYQVKVSGHAPEVYMFIDINEWNALTSDAQDKILTELPQIFGVSDIDPYHLLEVQLWKTALYNADPWSVIDVSTRIPPGSISFLSDGTILHDFLH